MGSTPYIDAFIYEIEHGKRCAGAAEHIFAAFKIGTYIEWRITGDEISNEIGF